MATQHTIQKNVVANARLYGGKWDNAGPQGTWTVTAGMYDSSVQHYGFFRFGEIDIPPYARIISAQFRFYVSSVYRATGWYFPITGVKDNGTLWTEGSRNGAGRNTAASNNVKIEGSGKWYTANIKAIAEAWRDGDMDPARGICITHSGQVNSYKVIDGRQRSNSPTLTIVYEIPASVPIPNASTVELGQQLTVNLTGVEPGVYHKVRYKVDDVLLFEDEIGAATSSEYTVPTAAGALFPDTLTGALTIECETYEDDEYTVSRGTVDATVTMTLPSDKAPTVAMDDGYPAKAWVEGVDPAAHIAAYVQGKGGVRVKLTGTPKYGATIAGYAVTCEGKAHSGGDVTHAPFEGSGAIKVYSYATDSRGVVSATREDTLTVAPWKQPQITAFSVQRVDANGNPALDGTRIKARIKATASSLTVDNVEENSLQLQVKFRAKGTEEWTFAKAVAAGGVSVDGSYVLTDESDADIADFDDMTGYDFMAAVADIYMTSTRQTEIASSEIVVDFNMLEGGLSVGGKSTGAKLESYKPAYFYGGIPQLDYSTDRVDTGMKWVDGGTVYRKVVITPTSSTQGEAVTASLGETAIGHVISCYGGYTNPNGHFIPVPYVHATVGYTIRANVQNVDNSPAVQLTPGSSQSLGIPVYMIVEYTLPD